MSQLLGCGEEEDQEAFRRILFAGLILEIQTIMGYGRISSGKVVEIFGFSIVHHIAGFWRRRRRSL
jgi:hypothetical protein